MIPVIIFLLVGVFLFWAIYEFSRVDKEYQPDDQYTDDSPHCPNCGALLHHVNQQHTCIYDNTWRG